MSAKDRTNDLSMIVPNSASDEWYFSCRFPIIISSRPGMRAGSSEPMFTCLRGSDEWRALRYSTNTHLPILQTPHGLPCDTSRDCKPARSPRLQVRALSPS